MLLFLTLLWLPRPALQMGKVEQEVSWEQEKARISVQ